jgi:proteasome lid subunit RPN8/RPN11
MTWKTEAEKHALDCLPAEACGLLAIIDGKKIYWPCKNLAANDDFGFFIIDPDDWADCEDIGEIIGIVHSHPKGSANPSENDIQSAEYLGYPWFIFSAEQKYWYEFKPKGYKKPELIGRVWTWGKNDCWSLITDWFEENKNIKIEYTERPKNFKEFVKNPLFEKTLPKLGFKLRQDNEDIQEGDVLLMENQYKTLSHVALYIGDQTILEHNIKSLSCRRIYDLDYIKATKKVYYYAA